MGYIHAVHLADPQDTAIKFLLSKGSFSNIFQPFNYDIYNLNMDLCMSALTLHA